MRKKNHHFRSTLRRTYESVALPLFFPHMLQQLGQLVPQTNTGKKFSSRLASSRIAQSLFCSIWHKPLLAERLQRMTLNLNEWENGLFL